MPYYLSEQKDKDRDSQKKGWTAVAAYVRQLDPYHHPITIHPSGNAREQVEDVSLLDLDMLHTGHADRLSAPRTVEAAVAAYAAEPRLPMLNGEVCYEGIGEACRQEVQRFMFWACVLSGACGHTYGANGVWQVNTREKPFGPSPHGMAWGHTPWEDAFQLPGSGQLGLAKRLLERYEWWRFEPHPEWVEPHWSKDKYLLPYAAGIPAEVRIMFLPSFTPTLTVKGIELATSYRAFLVNPVDRSEHDLGAVKPDDQGDWRIPLARLPIYQDWLLVLERRRHRPEHGLQGLQEAAVPARKPVPLKSLGARAAVPVAVS
jgi:hypothetical protein